MGKFVGVVGSSWGNSKSISSALNVLGCDHETVAESEDLHRYSHLIIAGVGSFASASSSLAQKGFVDALNKYTNNGGGVLGICLGMHLLYEFGSEGSLNSPASRGLALINGTIRSFDEGVSSQAADKSSIINIGWAQISVNRENFGNDLGLTDYDCYYFMHGYFARPANDEGTLATSYFSKTQFPAVVQQESIVGCQFHPEKSGPAGLKFLSSFLDKF